MLLLEAVIGGSRFHDAMWRRYRDPTTGLFRSPLDRGRVFHVIDQGAMIQIDAVLGWGPAKYPLLY